MPTNQSFDRDDGVTLKIYTDTRLEALSDKMDNIFRLNQAAIDKNEAAINQRLVLMNEFRAQIKDQTATFVTRSEQSLHEKFMAEQLRRLELSAAVLEGKASQSAVNRALAFSVISAILGLAGMVIGLTK
jgi:hypothetical protein